MNKYQAVIIGFGKAGKTLAVTLAKAGWRVALIEQSNAMYGGTCINIGCIPTKTLVHDAQQHTDFVRAIQRKNEVVNFLRNKNFHNLADMPNIDVIDGQAEFINNHSLRVHRPEGNLEIHGEKIFINTGAQTVVPPIPGITTTPGVYRTIEYKIRTRSYLGMIHPAGEYSPSDTSGKHHRKNCISSEGIQRRSSYITVHIYFFIVVLRFGMVKPVSPHY